MQKTIFILAVILLSTPCSSQAIRLVDESTSYRSLSSNPCLSKGDIDSFGIYPLAGGIQTNFHTESEFVALIEKLYYCNEPGSTGYFIFGQWEKDKDGKQKTIIDSIDNNWTKKWTISSALRIYPTFEKAKESKVYEEMVRDYSKEVVFIQKVDFLNKKFDGLYDNKGERVD